MMEDDQWRLRVKQVLRASPVFGRLEETAFDALADSLTSLPVTGGTPVLREGDQSDSMILVISGRLRVWRTGIAGEHLFYNEVGPGESVGEAGLILGQSRTANVSALRDSLLAILSRTAFEALLTTHPLAINRIFSQSIYNYLRHTPQTGKGHKCKSFAIVPLHAGCVTDGAANDLVAALSRRDSTHHLRYTGATWQAAENFSIGEGIVLLEDLEQQHDFIVFETEPCLSPWTLGAVRQSDQIIFVADARTGWELKEIERQLSAVPGFEMKRKHLVLLHAENAPRPSTTASWRNERKNIERVYPVRTGNADDYARVARFLNDAAVGVVLGGGGARGFAHVGVLKAMEEAGLPIDLVGGNSMGALIGAQYLCGVPLDEICERTRTFALGGEFPALPFISLLSGRRIERDLKRMFGDTTIDALWRPYFAAACNLSKADTAIQDSGELWRAVLASNSPAGLLPPVVHRGDLLVDGAILDNVPVAAMRARLGTPLEKRRGNGTIIAVDVDVRDDLGVSPELARLSTWEAIKGFFRNGDGRSPGIGDILYRAGHIGSLHQRARTMAMAEHYLKPPVAEFPLMGYRQAHEIAEVGYRYAVAEIERWNSP
jgi:NTE family protein/lysophospholipid hydrolase